MNIVSRKVLERALTWTSTILVEARKEAELEVSKETDKEVDQHLRVAIEELARAGIKLRLR